MMNIYKTKRWKQLRQKALKRDGYECVRCKENGRVTSIQHKGNKHKNLDVDHIKEVEHYPELAYELHNLQTLCVQCHNRKHNRYQSRFKRKANKWAEDERW